MKKVQFYAPGEVENSKIRHIAISMRCQGKWIFIKKKTDTAWSICSGMRGDRETPDAAAARIFCKVWGEITASILPVCPFLVTEENSQFGGMLYFVQLNDPFLNQKSTEFDVLLCDRLPEELMDLEIDRRLHFGTQGWLNMQSNADELWDVYDENRNLTGRLHRRGDFLKQGDYHLVVHVWILNQKGEFLLTKRAPTKGFPNTWETTGGAAQAGDDSLRAAIREVREETGLEVLPSEGEMLFSWRREDDFCDVWVFRHEFDLNRVVLLEGETVDKRKCTRREIESLYQEKKLVPYSYLRQLFERLGVKL